MFLNQLAEEAKIRVKLIAREKSPETVRKEAEALYMAELQKGSLFLQNISGREQINCPDEEGEGKSGSGAIRGGRLFGRRLAGPLLSFICECKKASPSRGLLSPDFPYMELAGAYERGGAAAISCLTEPKHFLGSDRYLSEIAERTTLPVLRKDFTVSEDQIYEAKVLGASAVLLIAALLSESQLREFRLAAESVGLDALVETHDGWEIETALKSGAGLIGINNRNLQDFTVDISTCLRLRREIPPGRLCIAESGIHTAEQIRALKETGFDGVLMGEALMCSPDPEQTLRDLIGA